MKDVRSTVNEGASIVCLNQNIFTGIYQILFLKLHPPLRVHTVYKVEEAPSRPSQNKKSMQHFMLLLLCMYLSVIDTASILLSPIKSAFMSRTVSSLLWSRYRDLALASACHPFVLSLQRGTVLKTEAFKAYIAQDAYYLTSFKHAFGSSLLYFWFYSSWIHVQYTVAQRSPSFKANKNSVFRVCGEALWQARR